jgi:hypothetical protein
VKQNRNREREKGGEVREKWQKGRGGGRNLAFASYNGCATKVRRNMNREKMLQLKSTPTLPPPKMIKNDSRRICYALTTH